uniref:ThiF family adenylyltransferase n=1 Tax=Streptomyces corallincola TaxID=2851888 RepID=UPI0027E307E2|nr:ThiF family adenylyltransferase [Streptomyces corallincola]
MTPTHLSASGRTPSCPDAHDPPQDAHRPVLLDARADGTAAALATLRDSGAVREIHDRIEEQLEELVRCLHPGERFDAGRMARATADLRCSASPQRYGTWVWYPWSGRLVHLLPEDDFRLVRTDRNRDKITREEQKALLGRRIGVIGLSVGNSAALTCAQEGVGGSFRLADFDRVSLSNLNRLRAGVHDLGIEKTVLAARQMYEIDPYLDIEIHREGVTEDTIGDFFGPADAPAIDLLVEECDTPWVKVAAREHARLRGVPVLMDANDRGLLDVERFDQEHGRPLFHGRAGDLTAADVRDLDPAAAVEFLLRVVDASRISPAMTDALGRIGTSLSSWPQLASGVALGGALVTDAARRVLLGRPLPSGRYYVDLDTLVGGAPAPVPAPVGAAS